MLSIKVRGKSVYFLLNQKFNLNAKLKDLIDHQRRNNCFVDLGKKTIDYLCTLIFKKGFHTTNSHYMRILDYINEDFSACLYGRDTPIFISNYNHTALHLLSFKGDEKALNQLIKSPEGIEIKVDAFGKSPIFYSIMKQHRTCAQIILKYLTEIKIQDKVLLFDLMSKFQNEFVLIIKSSFRELPMFLNRFIFQTNYKMISESIKLPELRNSEEILNPNIMLDETKSDNSIPAIVIYFSTSLPIQPYSKENIELLRAIDSCSNLKIFENLLIQKIIEFNWTSLMNWIRFYSLLALLNLIFFVFCIVYGRTNILVLVPFLVVCFMLFIWEILQMYSLKFAYFNEIINYIDIFMILVVIYWTVAGFLEIDTPFEEYALAFLSP